MARKKYLAIKNHPKFQHYKDRDVPWVKLHASTLDDADFLALPEVAQAHLMKLWALCGRMGHPLPNNPPLLAGKIGAKKLRLTELMAAEFLYETDNALEGKESSSSLDKSSQTSSDNLGKGYPSNARPPARREVEVEIEQEKPTTARGREGDPLWEIAGYAELALKLSEPAKSVIDAYCRAAKLPLATLASVNALHEREGFDWGTIDRALIEYGTANQGERLSAEGLRRFCLTIKRGVSGGGTSALDQFERGGEAAGEAA